MIIEKNNNEPEKDSQANDEKNNDQEMITLHNPLKPGTDIVVSKDEIENEQKYKEALTERD